MDSYFLDEEESLDVETLDLRRYYRALIKKWWLVAIITLAVTVPWAIYLKSQPPIYEAAALIRFKNFAGGDDVSLIQTRNTELRSRSFAQRVVAQLGLCLVLEQKTEDGFLNRSDIFAEFSTTQTPVSGDYFLRLTADGRYSLSMIIPDTEREKQLKTGSVADITNGLCVVNGLSFRLVRNVPLPLEVPFRIMSFRSAVESFQSRINVRWEDRAGTLMRLTLTDTDPKVVAEMTNRLAEIYIAQSSSVKKEMSQARVKILEEQLQKAREELEASERELVQFKKKYEVALDADQKGQLNQLALLEKKRDDLETTLKTLNDLLQKKEEEERALAGPDADPYATDLRYVMNEIASHPAFDGSAAMLIKRSRLKDLETQWRAIVNSTTERNIKARQVLAQIRSLHTEIEQIARREMIGIQQELEQTKREIAQQEYKLKQLPARESELSELTRRNSVLAKKYQDLLAKSQDATISAAVETGDIEILDPAIVPDAPTNKDKKQKAILGGLFGILLGMGVVVVTEFLNKTLRSVDDVRRYLKLPILGTIPQIDFSDVFDFQDSEKVKQIDQQLVTHDYSPTPIGEAYRSLRTNLMFTKETGRIRSLVITSNEPGDGKSFTAANLSITLAQLRSNTLLVDGDLRRGVLHNTFGVAKEPGFSNYLQDVVPLQSILNPTQIPNLTLISCGSLIPNPSELLGSHQMQRFLDEVRRKFDLIVFDTPPLNAATDAVVLGTQVDGTVIVIRAGKTHRDLAKSKLELFSNVPARVIGAILNGTTADMAHPGYSYYHY
ncbi:MAG: polysaccharide biosynthesis tyrosine autokinase [Calditrichaeota bacterium]|nr:MAG: polysaccharide biosynthesis tyrosine autokinase [Calditrichota bacterium]